MMNLNPATGVPPNGNNNMNLQLMHSPHIQQLALQQMNNMTPSLSEYKNYQIQQQQAQQAQQAQAQVPPQSAVPTLQPLQAQPLMQQQAPPPQQQMRQPMMTNNNNNANNNMNMNMNNNGMNSNQNNMNNQNQNNDERDPTDLDNNNLYIKGLWRDCTQIELDDLFKQFGVIAQSRVYGDGVGFVRFEHGHSAKAAIEAMDKKKVPRCADLLLVKYAFKKQRLNKRYVRENDGMMTKNTNNVYLRCLPHGFSEKELTDLCGQFGELTCTRLRESGVAFVRFKHAADANNAIQKLNGRTFQGHNEALLAKLANSDPFQPKVGGVKRQYDNPGEEQNDYHKQHNKNNFRQNRVRNHHRQRPNNYNNNGANNPPNNANYNNNYHAQPAQVYGVQGAQYSHPYYEQQPQQRVIAQQHYYPTPQAGNPSTGPGYNNYPNGYTTNPTPTVTATNVGNNAYNSNPSPPNTTNAYYYNAGQQPPPQQQSYGQPQQQMYGYTQQGGYMVSNPSPGANVTVAQPQPNGANVQESNNNANANNNTSGQSASAQSNGSGDLTQPVPTVVELSEQMKVLSATKPPAVLIPRTQELYNNNTNATTAGYMQPIGTLSPGVSDVSSITHAVTDMLSMAPQSRTMMPMTPDKTKVMMSPYTSISALGQISPVYTPHTSTWGSAVTGHGTFPQIVTNPNNNALRTIPAVPSPAPAQNNQAGANNETTTPGNNSTNEAEGGANVQNNSGDKQKDANPNNVSKETALRLHEMISTWYPQQANKLTGMFLQYHDEGRVLRYLNSEEKLKKRIDTLATVLSKQTGQGQAQQSK